MALAAVEELPWVLRQVFTSKLLPCHVSGSSSEGTKQWILLLQYLNAVEEVSLAAPWPTLPTV